MARTQETKTIEEGAQHAKNPTRKYIAFVVDVLMLKSQGKHKDAIEKSRAAGADKKRKICLPLGVGTSIASANPCKKDS